MHRHCGTNNRAPRWTFTDPCKPEVRPQNTSFVWLYILEEAVPRQWSFVSDIQVENNLAALQYKDATRDLISHPRDMDNRFTDIHYAWN